MIKFILSVLLTCAAALAPGGEILLNGGFDLGEWGPFTPPPSWSCGHNHIILGSDAGRVDGAEGGCALAMTVPWETSSLPVVFQSFRPPAGCRALRGKVRIKTVNDNRVYWRLRELRPAPGREKIRYWDGGDWREWSGSNPLPSGNIYALGDVTALKTENSGSASGPEWQEVRWQALLPEDGDAYVFEIGGGTASGDGAPAGIYMDSVSIVPLDGGGAEMAVTVHDDGRAVCFPAAQVDEILATPPVHTAEVGMVEGLPGILLDGEPITGLGWSVIVPANVSDSEIADMVHGTDFDLARVIFALGESCFHGMPYGKTWYGPDLYDWTPLDIQLERFCRPDDDTKIIIKIALDGVKWWCDMYPEDSIPVAGAPAGTAFVPDYISEQWRKDSRTALRALAAHIQSGPYADRVIGYQLFNGCTLDCNWPVNPRSRASLAYFREMLREKYGTDENLRAAWGEPDVTIDTAEPLAEFDWKTLRYPQLFIPAEAGHMQDTAELHNRLAGEVFIDFARNIKEATQGRALAGARHGMLFMGAWAGGNRLGGCIFRDYLNKSELDFLDQWDSYPGRGLGDYSSWVPVMPVQGMGLDRKLYVTQNDVRTHVGDDKGYGATANLRDTVAKQKAVMISSLTDGRFPYLWQMSYKFNIPELMPMWRKFSEIFRKSMTVPRENDAEICFVVDENMPYYLGADLVYDAPSSGFVMLDYSRYSWGRAGAPYHMIFLDQVEGTAYKVYVFFLTMRMSEEEIRRVHRTLAANNAVAVFVWAAGVLDGDGAFSMDNMERLIGMEAAADDRPCSWETVASGDVFPADAVLGTVREAIPEDKESAKKKFSPAFTVTDPEALVMGVHPGDGRTMLAGKEQNGWYSIYSSSAILTPAVLRKALELAGARIYMPSDDALYLNRSFVGVHTRSTTREIHLNFPESTALYEVFSETELPEASSFTIPVDPCSTYLWFRGGKAQWEALGAARE